MTGSISPEIRLIKRVTTSYSSSSFSNFSINLIPSALNSNLSEINSNSINLDLIKSTNSTFKDKSSESFLVSLVSTSIIFKTVSSKIFKSLSF